jgi:putative ubiquitin-RnfH superfamily antitoxin RatB of RatAB toxin-antitoxin module
MAIEVIYGAGPGQIDRSTLTLAPGATVADALAASGVLARCGLVLATAAGETTCEGTDERTGDKAGEGAGEKATDRAGDRPGNEAGPAGAATSGSIVVSVGLWGREVPLSTRLRDRDRVELYRPLQVDPKEARRLRYRQQGERGRRRVRREG